MSIQTQTLSQQIADAITARISSGELRPGTKLLEATLKEEFLTSRAPIREAFLILEQKGIVERIARKGVYVKKYSHSEIIEFYKVVYDLTNYAIVNSNIDEKRDVLENIKVLIDRLEVNAINKDLNNSYLIIENLHQAIFELTGNRTLLDIYERVNTQWSTFRYFTLTHPSSLNNSWKEYKDIFNFIENNDIESALKVLKVKENRALNIIKNLSIDE